MKKFFPVLFVVVAGILVISSLIPRKPDSKFDIAGYGRLPVLEGGRYKPIDSVARTTMLLFRGKQTGLNVSGEKVQAIEWLMYLTLDPERAASYPVFLVHNDDVKDLIGASNPKQKHFSYAELFPSARKIQEQVQSVPQESALQTPMQRELIKLFNNLIIYQRLAFSFRPPVLRESVTAEYENFMQTMKEAAALVDADGNVAPDQPAVAKAASYLRTYGNLSDNRAIKFAPEAQHEEHWLNLSEALMSSMHQGAVPDTVLRYGRLADALASADVQGFAAELQGIKAGYAAVADDYPAPNVSAEWWVNQLQPFGLAMALYIWLFVGVLVGWLTLDERLLKWVFWILVAAFAIHTFGLLARMIIQGRPPVTNLYSSAIFVGWGAVALGVLLERYFKNGLGSAVSAIIGFMTLIIANHLMTSGDTMEMMRAVLDSNFWLATHVITISLGYSAVYLAGFLAILYFVLAIFTNRMNPELSQTLVRMVYGIVCFALFFSFIGTVLGGIWADQSWGRFWGWDPRKMEL
jgi:ABC-type transport system involved in cytochrome c biogenesis permease subunit